LKRIRTRVPGKKEEALTCWSCPPPSSKDQRGPECRRLLHELVWRCLRGQVSRERAAQALGEVALLHAELASTVVDVLSLADVETSTDTTGKDDRERFKALLKESERFLPEATLKERMEIETLGEASVIKQHKKFFNSIIKLKTKLFYKQQKYNLFREEAEGYAKLVTELNSTADKDDDDQNGGASAEVFGVIKSIIGFFNLDPNRVLDIILESFESQLCRHAFFVALLKLYEPDSETLNELMGFKFRFYEMEGDGCVPKSLYQLTAFLVQFDLLNLDVTWAMLNPDEEGVIAAEAEKELAEAK